MNIRYINDMAEADRAIRSIKASAIGLDTETYPSDCGLDPFRAKVRLLQIYDSLQDITFVLDMPFIGMIESLHALLVNPHPLKIIHHAKFEYKQIQQQYGVRMSGIYCTMVAAQVLLNGKRNTFNLEDLSLDLLNVQLNKEYQGSDWGAALSPEQIQYAAQDAWACYHLWTKFDVNTPILDMEMTLIPVVAQMELNGLHYDYSKVQELGEILQSEYQGYLREAQSQLPRVQLPKSFFTPSGGLGKKARDAGWLDGTRPPETRDDFIRAFTALGVEIPKARNKTTGEMKTALSKETYGKIQHPAGKVLEKWRRTKHLYDSFIKPAEGWYNPITRLIHPTINQCGTVTGRFSMKEPNFQQQPRRDGRFRRILYAPTGYSIVKADYSQIEMRVMAQVSGDRNLIQAYRTGGDVHSITASQIFKVSLEEYKAYETNKVLKEQRQLGKNVNFGSLYGQGAAGLQQYIYKEANVDYTPEECEKFLAAFFAAYPGIKEYHNNMKRYVIQTVRKNQIDENIGWVEVSTLFGRIRHWPDVQVTPRISKNGHHYESVRINEELNMPIQGTVGDAMKFAAVELHARMDHSRAKLLLQVHDEFVAEVRDDYVEEFSNLLREIMIEVMTRVITVVPIEVDITVGKNWAGEK